MTRSFALVALDALVVATDVYVWKLLRRDMASSPAVTTAIMKRLVGAALAMLPCQLIATVARAVWVLGGRGLVRPAFRLPRFRHDVHLVAIASGPGVTAPFWETPRPYQPSSKVFTPRVLGATNPVWLDADGDGKFTPARAYAEQLVKRHGTAAAKLFPALADYDEAVAAQAAIALKARRLVFMSDVPGLMRDPKDPGTLITHLPISEVPALKATGVVDKGMIPKVDSAVAAIQSGVEKVQFVDGRQQHSVLLEIFTDAGVGTEVVA